jgi:hypothetical protein
MYNLSLISESKDKSSKAECNINMVSVMIDDGISLILFIGQ